MKAMLYADWRSVRRSVKAILWVVLVIIKFFVERCPLADFHQSASENTTPL